jgi:mono/diheme cytochrome c family protein
MGKVLKIIGIVVGILALGIVAVMAYVKLALPNVGPPPVIAIRATPAQIEHGRYLANHVANCMSCHSTRDFLKRAGPVVSGTEGKGGEGFLREDGFPGNYYAPNLTPAHLLNWSDGQIYRAITTGVSRDGHALFPVMPYEKFAHMDPNDIKDIISYLRSLKPIQNDVPASESDFPMNFIINTIPAKSEGGRRPAPDDLVAYGRYMATFASCITCHTRVDKQGQAVPGMNFAGGREFSMPTGTVRSANITPAKSGIGLWTRDAFIARFRSYADREAQPAVGEGEVNSIMPWTAFAHLSDQDLSAIYAYLRTQKPIENKMQRFTLRSKMVAER